jgi:small subunit ribosomal protein S16
MALVIRLRQQGAHNKQTFRLVVMDRRNPRDGKYLEMLGWYTPQAENEKGMHIDVPRVMHWVGLGACLSERAEALVARASPEFTKQLAEKTAERRERKHKKKK